MVAKKPGKKGQLSFAFEGKSARSAAKAKLRAKQLARSRDPVRSAFPGAAGCERQLRLSRWRPSSVI